ncbi:MAG: murein biosynthesis integral membrane protein MurJ [Candidatus Kerfeldbacteria bacterium]|nr:murein biosynthesis integral membrane protein MurJ [Candidatus Kerfeldbacteria bacterium]
MSVLGPKIYQPSMAALLIASFSVLSRVLGVVRDRLLAGTFGAGSVLDAYYAAFKIPDFIFNTFVLGAIASAFIPVFIGLKKKSQVDAWQLTSAIINILLAVLLVLAAGGIIFADRLLPLIAPGFDTVTQTLAVKLTRFMLLAIIFFGTSNVLGSVLQAEKKFLPYALAPVLYNAGILGSIWFLVPILGPMALAWGVIGGSFLHLLIQLPAVRDLGYRWHLRPKWNSQSVKQVVKLIIPRTLGLAASSINNIVITSFISRLGVGSLAAFTLAANLQSFPINVFGVSLAIAVFPIFSEAYVAGNSQQFSRQFAASVRRILFYIIPLAVLLLILRAQIVRIILGSGAFNWNDTIRTAQILGYLSLALITDSLIPIVSRAFYALTDTRTPVLISLISIAVNLTLLITLRPLGLAGVGIAYVTASSLNLILLITQLARKIPSLGADYIISGTKYIALATLAAGSAAYLTLHWLAPLVDMHTFIGIFTQGFSAAAAGLLLYILLTIYWQLPEVNFVRNYLTALRRLLLKYESGKN